MILQALVNYYERKIAIGDDSVSPEGWVRRGIDYVVVIDQNGECVNFDTVFTREKGKAAALDVLLPAIGKQALKHSNSGKDANLLWDNASFVLGRGSKGTCKLESFISTIEEWLRGCDDAGVDAVKAFCEKLKRKPELAGQQLIERLGLVEDFEKRDPVMAFRLTTDNTMYIHGRPAVRAAYERTRLQSVPDIFNGTCLVTGDENVPIARNETVIKNVWGAQPAGANIVSFNHRAFESYGKCERQGENSPISRSASSAYTNALTFLLRKDSTQRLQVGDSSTVFWADKPTELEASIVNIFGKSPKDDDPDRNVREVASLYKAIENGLIEKDEGKTRFFVLGLAPNEGRIAIRFWHNTTVAEIATRVRQHFDDLAIVRAEFDPPYPTLFRLLISTATQTEAEKIAPNLGGELMRSILAGLPYPQTLLAAAVRRIRAGQSIKDDKGRSVQNVTYVRAALIKACINRATRYSNPIVEEELKVSLDESNTNAGYRLGRLFAVLERIQEEANSGINATIRDRFYGAASSTPVTVFSTLLKLKNHHISKLGNRGRAVNLEKRIGEIMDGISDFPAQLPLADQGRFAIGYYHQRQEFFKKADTLTEGA